MLFMSFLSWWYGAGWDTQIQKITRRLAKLADQFSIIDLLATLFSPFHQISAGKANGATSLNVKYRMWSDRLFSRFFGAFVRFFTILAGIFVLAVSAFWGLLRITGWLILPLTPLFGVFLSVLGWVPWK